MRLGFRTPALALALALTGCPHDWSSRADDGDDAADAQLIRYGACS